MEINGGLRAGNNLFHSFEEFSVPEGMEAAFENALDIENIFARVTGDSGSNIKGTISAQGTANLFLMNSNGIVFSEKASINVGGSFLATTTNSIQFEDGTEFASSATEDPTITPSDPNGFAFKEKAGAALTIKNTGNGITAESLRQPTEVGTSSSGLQVNSGKTLALIGNNVNLNGGIISAEGGRIEIGSVRSGSVGITEDLELIYDNVNSFGSIELGQQSLVNTTGTDEGSITLRGANLFLSDGSKILLQNRNGTASGDLYVNTSNSVVIEGTSTNGEVGSGIQAETTSSGQAGNINLNTQTVVLKDGARVGSNTYGDGLGGNVTINASDSVQIIENSSNIINASTYASGDAGSISLSTNELRITDGGGISSSTLGTGDGGNLSVEAKDIELISDLSEPDSLSAISAVSFGLRGNAGNIAVDTDTLKIIDGGAVSTSSIGDGAAGNITVNAFDSIKISGQTDNFLSAISSAVIARGDLDFRRALGIPEIPGGCSGNISVNTPLLQIVRGGEVNTANEGTGDAGTVSINTKQLNLSQSRITAATESGKGNINIDTDSLQIDSESQIVATAGNKGESSNIAINTTNLTAKKTV